MHNRAYENEFYDAVRRGDIPEVRRLIQLGVDPNEGMSFEFEQDPLGCAIRHDDVAMMRALVECGADPDQEDYEGYTPAQVAVQGAHSKALRALLSFGDPAAREARTLHALCTAASYGKVDLIPLLLDTGVNINASEPKGVSPLIAATGYRNIFSEMVHPETRETIVRLLLERGADVHFAVPSGHSKGLTALHAAAAVGHQTLATWLKEAGAQLTLPIATMLGDTEGVRALLGQGELPDSLDSEGNVALHYAAKRGHTQIVHLLLEAGANPDLPGSYWASGALSLAAEHGHTEAARALLQYGAGKDKTADVLGHATLSGRSDIVLLLLHAGWNIDGIDTDDSWSREHLSPLMQAASENCPEMVRLLIANGADANLANRYDYTALMCAAQHNCIAAGQALLEGGADIRNLYDHDMTAFAQALEQNVSNDDPATIP